MYALLGIDAVLRITAALVVLFVAVPRLARPRPAELDRLQWFWWCLGFGITLLTLSGQVFTLLQIHSTLTLVLLLAALVLFVRARVTGRAVTAILHDLYRSVVLFSLNVLEGRVNVRRRARRTWRRGIARLNAALAAPAARWHLAGWSALVAGAAAIRLYRPFATANLGFSDTYVHLYLMRLLEEGRQVDPAWGPYPRGMHFLLMAIHQLTNVDQILLMNFFGAIVGVLMTIAVADTARRLTGSLGAGLTAGAIFATMIGGARQYFLLGGSIITDNIEQAKEFARMPYADLPPTRAELDVLLTVFQRETATLPQELAIVLLFPAAMFLFAWLELPGHEGTRARGREGERLPPPPHAPVPPSPWNLTGFLFCTSAIAATHPGVLVPLVLLCIVTVIAARAPWADLRRAVLTGAIGVALGSTWMLAYIAYPRLGGTADASGATAGAMYYFPFLRTGDAARIITWVSITPFLIACLVIAIVLVARRRPPLVWAGLAAIVFLLTHVASRFGWPEIVEVRRNASWLAMTLAILIGVALAQLPRVRVVKAVPIVLLALWLWRVPLAGAHEKLINYSGYSGTAQAVLEIQRRHEPFTWTLVTYGQEYPMVLGKGFHLAAADFLERYDPDAPIVPIPTKYVFVAVEKNPHPFEINTWASRFSRADVEQRLQTWCFLYQLSHRNMRVFRDDENVRVYVIERTDAETSRIAEGKT